MTATRTIDANDTPAFMLQTQEELLLELFGLQTFF